MSTRHRGGKSIAESLCRLMKFCLLLVAMLAYASSAAFTEAKAEDWAETRYESIVKYFHDSFEDSSLTARLKTLTEGPPQLFYLTSIISDPQVVALSRAVVRLDILRRNVQGLFKDDFCTATMITAQMAVTAAHCIPGRTDDPPLVKARLVAGFDGSSDMYNNIEIRDVVLLPQPTEFRLGDIALIKIGIPFVKGTHPVTLTYRDPIRGETLIMISHPLGQVKRLSSGYCTVASVENLADGQFTHSCASLGGSSGALLFSATDGAIVGVHSGDSGQRSNVAMSFAPLVQALQTSSSPVPAFQHVDTPSPINRTGVTVSDSQIHDDFSLATKHKTGKAWLKALTGGDISVVDLDQRFNLSEIAAGNADISALAQLHNQGVSFANPRGQAIVDTISKQLNSLESSDGSVLDALLTYGAPVAIGPGGQYPFCEQYPSSILVKVYAKHGHTNAHC